ncbi:MAG: hypothetical protein AAFU73_21440 [Planctomycetota bacterium]
MPSLLDFAADALRLGRYVFVAATPEAPRDGPSLEALRQALRGLRGVGAVVAEQGFALPRVAGAVDADDAPFPAAVLVASVAEARRARELGADLVQQSHARIGVAGSVDAPDAAPAELVAVALEGARLAADAGGPGGTLVHTELYDLVRSAATIGFEERAPDEDLVPRPTGREPEHSPPHPARDAPTLDAKHASPPAPPMPRADDPFAGAPLAERDLTEELALTLTAGIAPPVAVLRAEERAQSALVAQLTSELEALRAEREVRRSAEDPTLLERRIQKLVRQLDDAEDEIARLRSALEEDPGVASTYRAVQGIGPDAPEAQRAALASVFRASRPEGDGA